MLNPIKRKRLIYLASYIALACALVYIFRPVYLLSIALVLVPPSLANFFWLRDSRRKVLLFSGLTTLLFAPPVELMARLADAWDVQSVLPRLLGIAPLENILFAFLNFFWVLSFYEYFVDADRGPRFSRFFRWIILLYCLFFLLVFTLFFVRPGLVRVDYSFLAILILIVPGIIIFRARPRLLAKTWLPLVFFAYVFFIYEIVSLLIGSWWWPGHYLFPLDIYGHVFPLDDVLIWYILSTPVLIGGYEFFVDDGR